MDATSSEARALLEKIKRDMLALCRLFRCIDDTEKGIRYSFDPVEQHMDNALRQEQPSVEHIHCQLRAVNAKVEDIKTKIRRAYNLPLGDRDAGEDQYPVAPVTTGMAVTKKMEEVRYSQQMRHLKLTVSGLEARVRGSLLCLAAFPEGAVIKKRLLIHWWIGEGLVESADAGKGRFDELVAKGFIIPVPSVLCDTVHRCTVRPWMRHLLIDVAKRDAFLEQDSNDFTRLARRVCLTSGKALSRLSADARAIYNIDQKYVELGEGWFAGKKELCTLQLGQWRELGPHEQIANPMASHIEVSGLERFADIASCKSLRYISFRGISRIESLPNSIGKLRELVVLDLRACHNLEELGQGITRLDRLEYLDLSECHLLGGMPKGLGRLTQLQVLKGFVVANTNSKDPCHLNELTKLEKLRKLGIVIGKMAVPTDDEFLKLGELRTLKSLTIRWGLLTSEKDRKEDGSASHPVAMMKFAFPSNLAKLDLHCFPLTKFPQWVPKGVKKLYIRGGKLATLGDEEDWEVEVLRLRFLGDLHYNHDRLERCFKKLDAQHTEIHACPNFLPK